MNGTLLLTVSIAAYIAAVAALIWNGPRWKHHDPVTAISLFAVGAVLLCLSGCGGGGEQPEEPPETTAGTQHVAGY